MKASYKIVVEAIVPKFLDDLLSRVRRELERFKGDVNNFTIEKTKTTVVVMFKAVQAKASQVKNAIQSRAKELVRSCALVADLAGTK